jgi:hypothetical protein
VGTVSRRAARFTLCVVCGCGASHQRSAVSDWESPKLKRSGAPYVSSWAAVIYPQSIVGTAVRISLNHSELASQCVGISLVRPAMAAGFRPAQHRHPNGSSGTLVPHDFTKGHPFPTNGPWPNARVELILKMFSLLIEDEAGMTDLMVEDSQEQCHAAEDGRDTLGFEEPQVPIMANLCLKFQERVLREVVLTGGVATIGRQPDNLIRIDNPIVSGHHAKVCWEGSRYILQDMESFNGTFVNNQRIVRRLSKMEMSS